jgi:hypothetical protein
LLGDQEVRGTSATAALSARVATEQAGQPGTAATLGVDSRRERVGHGDIAGQPLIGTLAVARVDDGDLQVAPKPRDPAAVEAAGQRE